MQQKPFSKRICQNENTARDTDSGFTLVITNGLYTA